MPTYIIDTDSSKVDNVTTFATMPALVSAIQSGNGGSGNLSGLGRHDIKLRCSTGVPYSERLLVNGLIPNATDNVVIEAEFSNGYPFVLTDPDNSTETSLLALDDDFVTVGAAQFGAGMIEAKVAETNNRVLFAGYKSGNEIKGWILNGKGLSSVGGLYSTADMVVKNCLVVGCKRGFYGAARMTAGSTIDQSTIYDCGGIRLVGPLTNSLVLRTDLANTGENDGLDPLSDNNAFDVDQSTIRYASTQGDANSFFNIAENAETVPLLQGGVALKQSSILSGVSSTGGAVGAWALALQGACSITGPITRGSNFTMSLTGHRAGVSAEVYLREQNGDGTEYSCTLVTYDDFSATATAPTAGEMPAIAQAEARLVPVISQ